MKEKNKIAKYDNIQKDNISNAGKTKLHYKSRFSRLQRLSTKVHYKSLSIFFNNN